MSDDVRPTGSKSTAEPEVRLSQREADEMRTRVRDLAQNINRTTWEVARILYLLWADDRHVQRWGYPSWSAWAEHMGINRRKAEYLRQLYEWFAVHHPLNTFVLARLTKLEWTKARLLARYGVTADNALDWISVAETETREELERRLKEWRADPGTSEGEANATSVDTAPREVFRPRRFTLADAAGDDASQWAIVDQALRAASTICGSDKEGHLLTMICTDFLATNDIQRADMDAALKYVSKIERLLGKRLVVVDTDTTRIEYGADTLRALAGELDGDE